MKAISKILFVLSTLSALSCGSRVQIYPYAENQRVMKTVNVFEFSSIDSLKAKLPGTVWEADIPSSATSIRLSFSDLSVERSIRSYGLEGSDAQWQPYDTLSYVAVEAGDCYIISMDFGGAMMSSFRDEDDTRALLAGADTVSWQYSLGTENALAQLRFLPMLRETDGLRYGFKDAKGKICIEAKYEHVFPSSGGKTLVVDEGAIVRIDAKGRRVSDTGMKMAGEFSDEGLAPVLQGDAYGFIDTDGSLVVECRYSKIHPYEKGVMRASRSGGHYLVDTQGHELNIVPYSEIGSFHPLYGLAKVSNSGRYGLVDRRGREVLPCEFDHIFAYEDSLVRVMRDSLYGLYNILGEEIVAPSYEFILPYRDTLAKVRRDSIYGFIDRRGVEVLACTYDVIADFDSTGTYARVQKDGKWGLIGRSLDPIAACRYGYIYDFEDGYARTTLDGEDGLLDSKGRFGVFDKKGRFGWYDSRGRFKLYR